MRLPLALALLFTHGVSAHAQDGLTLFQPFTGSTAYVVDGAGAIVHSWPGTANPGLAVYLTDDGDLLRTTNLTSAGPGSGGGLERWSWGGTQEWSFSLSSPTITPHHDVERLPNGNILMIVWEEIGTTAAVAAGRNPATVGSNFQPDALYEIAETGPSSGSVVWEWRAMDHVVQDINAVGPNFGVVADHPELIDINFGPSGDWLHFNGIDYNPQFDQIAISVPNFNEIWVIDHSTTTFEAAGHTGGNSGKGGDLLYRWGNPQAYGRGTAADQQLYFNHDIQWIEPGRPGAGNLIIFNNGVNRPTGSWSSADEWTPPVDGSGNYAIAPGAAYGPTSLVSSYSDPANFFSNIMGGVERLENGNTLICEATSGQMFEVDPVGTIVWSYTNPFGGLPFVFKARRYADCDSNAVADLEDLASGSATDSNGNGVLDGCEGPVNYCTATTNSTGVAASIGWAGSTSIAANDLSLVASSCPANQFGVFLYSPNQGSSPLGDGLLCVSGPFVRLPITSTNAGGVASYALDNQNLPSNSPPLSVGTTWNFTFWFRDPTGGPAGSNLSDGLTVNFQP